MHLLHSKFSKFAFSAVVAAVLVGCGGGSSSSNLLAANQLYSETNAGSNTIVRMARSAVDGSLTVTDTTSTGGAGSNGQTVAGTSAAANSLDSQFAITVSSDGKTLFAVNAGDDSISSFSIDATGKLTLQKKNQTTGNFPNSLAYSKGYLYAAFLGSKKVIAYKVNSDDSLTLVGEKPLTTGGDFVPTQVAVSTDGAFLLVGGKSSAIISYPIGSDGSLGAAVRNATIITVPFAGVFLANRIYVTADVATSSLSSYQLNADGTLTAISQIIPNSQGASCWLSITPNGKWAYVGTISVYSISGAGALTLVNAVAADEKIAVAGDSWISSDGKYLYSTYLKDGSVVSYRIDDTTGALTKVGAKVQVTPANGTASSPMQGVVGL